MWDPHLLPFSPSQCRPGSGQPDSNLPRPSQWLHLVSEPLLLSLAILLCAVGVLLYSEDEIELQRYDTGRDQDSPPHKSSPAMILSSPYCEAELCINNPQ